jgi:hypothetical protein
MATRTCLVSSLMRRAWPLLAVLAWIAAVAPACAEAASQAPGSSVITVRLPDRAPKHGLPQRDPLTPRLYLPYSQTVPPDGFTRSARQARQIAAVTSDYREALARYGRLEPHTYISPLPLRQGSFWHWDILYTAGGKDVLEIEIHPYGRVVQVTKPPDIGWPLLIGLPGVLGGKLNSPWLWLALGLIFLLPFAHPRRPFRLLHLDLLMLLGFGISQAFFTAGKPGISVPLFYPFLAYAAVRAAIAGFRPARRPGQLMPFVSTRFLVAGVVLMVALRIGFGIAYSHTFDVSAASEIGADRITHGLPLYVDNSAHGDTYGPVAYLSYVPFELVFGLKIPELRAAHAATLTFDVLMVIGLFLLGRTLRRGPPGTRLGAGLAWAWTAYPFTSLVIASNTNDVLVPLFIVYGLILIRSPPARGFMAGLATMGKFAPGLVAPLLIVGRGPFRRRPVLIAGAAWAAVCAGLVYAFLPAGGLHELWNTTLGFQVNRTSPLAIWERHPSIDWIQPILSAAVVLLAIVVAFLPRRRSVGQIAALCGALLAASQLSANYWLYFYVVWFAPFLFIALFEEYADLGPAPTGLSPG